MKLTIHQGIDCTEPEITICCHYMDSRLKRMVEYISQYTVTLEGYTEEGMAAVPVERVYYMESVDNHTFLYQEQEVYQSKESLSALEKKLVETSFVRVSKSCLLNVFYLKSVRPMFNHRMEATLLNGEKVMISRTYIEALKKKMMSV